MNNRPDPAQGGFPQDCRPTDPQSPKTDSKEQTGSGLFDLCPCGKPLHYANKARAYMMKKMVRELGPTIPVQTPFGTWAVPRHYVALHGFHASELPELAQRYGFKKL